METKKKIMVFLDPGHCKSTPGKRSLLLEDGTTRLYEYAYVREIVKRIEAELDKLGIEHWNTHPEDDFVYQTKGTCSSLDSRDLVLRVNRINKKYDEMKAKGYKTFMISVHVDAAGNGSAWSNATGWTGYTTVGKTVSDKLADCLYDAAEKILLPLNKKIRTDKTDGDRDKESNFYIIKQAKCACVLTENFFQDNHNDVLWLMSEEGKKAITDIHV